MKNLIISIAMVFIVSGCVTPPQKMNTSFNADLFAPFVGQGTAIVTGQAFLKTLGGDVKVGAGNQVELVPITPYIQERLDRATIKDEKLEPRDPGVLKFVRTTVADAGGNFEFKGVPAGRYVLYCEITWMVSGGYIKSITGGLAYGVATVKDGESVKIIVTR